MISKKLTFLIRGKWITGTPKINGFSENSVELDQENKKSVEDSRWQELYNTYLRMTVHNKKLLLDNRT